MCTGVIETGRAVDVTAHRQSWMLRAGVVAIVAAGAVIGPVAPALADVTQATIDPIGDFHPGDKQSLKVHATGTGTGKVDVTGLTGDFDISLAAAKPSACNKQSSSSCSFTFADTGGLGKKVWKDARVDDFLSFNPPRQELGPSLLKSS